MSKPVWVVYDPISKTTYVVDPEVLTLVVGIWARDTPLAAHNVDAHAFVKCCAYWGTVLEPRNVETYGCRTLHLSLCSRKIDQQFLITKTGLPILGADFLQTYWVNLDDVNGWRHLEIWHGRR